MMSKGDIASDFTAQAVGDDVQSQNLTDLNGHKETGEPTKRIRPRKKGPNYAQLHSRPLPLSVYPLPAFTPTHPISLLRLAYTFLAQWWKPPSSHTQLYSGYFSSDTRSVHITDPQHIRALWESGFFGKGLLSRSEPSWMDREKASVRSSETKGRTAEENTAARRQERRLFKLERARLEREKIERQRLLEKGKFDATGIEAETETEMLEETAPDQAVTPEDVSRIVASETGEKSDAKYLSEIKDRTLPQEATQSIESDDDDLDVEIVHQEHLQLTLEESFFLSYALGILQIKVPSGDSPNDSAKELCRSDLLKLFCRHGTFSLTPSSKSMAPDDQFLLNYVTYHHFRSLGWVVRSGVKFSVDYLLYNRGPVFAHAEFAVLIWPSYSAAYWSTQEGRARRRIKTERDWWWLHCVNRVQSQVRKSLVLVYVDVPALPTSFDGDIGKLLTGYKISEFVVKRWLANRSRD